ncbi:hypothetical protein [Candidatus Halobonum tyrrellensis]|uniref:Uncharacterized protein n=1 Tax=Candidatus Halobonum tyrrellensis G22 TaxID=1324957 RepID=V4IU97_9EURY|nr:hypothetical protein [Candidatus Halobonum tyrrellensis]ESP86787.1 hypothetical protein K933_17357 [Candidatus Halobonum tyrrellensis G22]
MSENTTPTQNGTDATLANYDAPEDDDAAADADDYPTECPHGVDLRFFADGEMACFECWCANREGGR